MPVYFIQQGESGPVKIGFATSVDQRIRQLKTSSPAPLRLLGAIETKKENERFIHTLFGKFRLRGEWFKPDKSIFEFIKKYNSFQYIQSPTQKGNGDQLGFDDILIIHASPLVKELDEELEQNIKTEKAQTKDNSKTHADSHCIICGKKIEFETSSKKKYGHLRKYCSDDCRKIAYSKSFVCKSCGKEFLSPTPKKYCSAGCEKKGSTEDVANCAICGNLFRRINPGHIYCSTVCAQVAVAVRNLKKEGCPIEEIKEKFLKAIDKL
jgi:hypothetical protein